MAQETNAAKPVETAQLVRAVKHHYGKEYFLRATKERKGFLGAVNRFYSRFFEDRLESKVLLPVTAVGLGLMAIAGVGAGIAGVFGSTFLATVSHLTVRRDANRAMDRDISSGELTNRYVKEVLQPNLDAARQAVDALTKPAVGTAAAAAQFDSAAQPSATVQADKVDPAAGIIPVPKK